MKNDDCRMTNVGIAALCLIFRNTNGPAVVLLARLERYCFGIVDKLDGIFRFSSKAKTWSCGPGQR